MTTGRKVALVLAGYVLAIIGATMAVMFNDWMIGPVALQASSGMTAFGDVMLFLVSLAVLSFPVTIAALWFVGKHFLQRRPAGRVTQ